MRLKHLIPGLLVVCILTSAALADDTGIPDTVRLNGGPLVVGQSRPISLSIVNDELVYGWTLGFEMMPIDSGFAVYDSVKYVGRLTDPNVLGYRTVNTIDINGIPPDVILCGAAWVAQTLPLPIGNDAIIEIYFTGQSVGQMSMDSICPYSAAPFKLSVGIYPQFASADPIQIIDGNPPPTLTLPSDPFQIVAGNSVGFQVEAESPDGFPITMSITEVTGYDDDSMVPVNSPTLSAGNPAYFSWVSTSEDIGIWAATIEACDSTGTCVSGTAEIQVVESEDYLLSFNMSEFVGTADASKISHGNFDSDPYPEVVLGGYTEFYSPCWEFYDFGPDGYINQVFSFHDGSPRLHPNVGYFNGDEHLDVVVMAYGDGSPPYCAVVYLGNGDNSFTRIGNTNDGLPARSMTLGEFTGDNHLDLAGVFENVRIYEGNSQGVFDQVLTIASTSGLARSVNSADFNGDGYDDLAIGTDGGLEIHLNDGAGGFPLSHFYPLTYGTVDVEITNKGSDFNNDDIFDLCMSTPSVGGGFSELNVFLGQGDGQFTQTTARTLKGQMFGNSVGDINGDLKLDIVFVNGAEEYVSILFGNGDGSFTNELRFDIPHRNPTVVDCFDADLDGDMDFAVSAIDYTESNSFFIFKNQLNQSGFTIRSTDFAIRDNAIVELTSPSGREFNSVRSTMSSAAMHRRNLDANGTLDCRVSVGTVERGEYALSAMPRPDLPTGELFTIEFTIDEIDYRLAKDIPMSESGYEFSVHLDHTCYVMPRPGRFTAASTPVFNWPGRGDYDFQLASDIDFDNIIVSITVSDNSYIPDAPLSVTDTTAYFWRVKPFGAPEFDCLYVFNLTSGSSSGCGDADGSGEVDIDDIVYVINYVFLGGPSPVPYEAGDVNCSGGVDIDDIVWLINFIFTGGYAPCDIDGDGVPNC